LNDKELVRKIIELRYSSIPIAPEKQDRLWQDLRHVKDLTGLAFVVLAIENDDGTATSPFRDREWVAEAIRTMHRVIEKHRLEDIKLNCGE
jgi:hypothetical protein